MTGFLMCPKCGSFIEVHEVSRVVICPQCGTIHKLPPTANKSYCGKENYNSLPEHTFMQNFKHVYVTSERKSHAVRDYKCFRFKRELFNIGCDAMKNGNFSKALNIFDVFPDFPGTSEKVKECRRVISQKAYSEAFDTAVRQLSEACKKFKNLTPTNVYDITAIMKYELIKKNIPVDGEAADEILAFARKKHAEFMKNYEAPKRTSDIMIILGVALQGLVMWIIFKILGALM